MNGFSSVLPFLIAVIYSGYSFSFWGSTPVLTGDRLLSMLTIFVWFSLLCLHVWYGKTLV